MALSEAFLRHAVMYTMSRQTFRAASNTKEQMFLLAVSKKSNENITEEISTFFQKTLSKLF